ncbi:MAG: DNA repair protein RadC [Bacteroidales bacterium]|nr:DNA repair protein RadC [Bacteroidales bacterium]
MISRGPMSLSDAELVGIMIGSGNGEMTAVDIARSLLNKYNNNLNELGLATVKDLMKIKGIGEARAVNILTAMEIGRRRASAEPRIKQQITSSHDLYKVFASHISDLNHEEMWAIFLSPKMKIISTHQLSKGGTKSTVVDVRLLTKMALDDNANSIVLGHNHPSGEVQPSKEDFNLTKTVKNAVNLFDIRLLDHIIVGNNKYYSFSDENEL